MRIIITCILIYIIGFTSCFQSENKIVNVNNDIYTAEVIFNDSIHDFGTLSGDSLIKSYDFIYTNTGNVPAVVLTAVTSCNCTSVKYFKEPILPGQSNKITVIYDGTNDNSGYFNKSIKIRFNSPKIYNLKIQGRCQN